MTNEQIEKMLSKHDIALTALENLAAHHDAVLARIEEAALKLLVASQRHDAAIESHDAALTRLEKLVEAFIRSSQNGGAKKV